MKPTIRNDDVAYDTSPEEFKTFCEICDKHGYQILHAVIPFGEHKKSNRLMDNIEIVSSSKRKFIENREVADYLRGRNDLIGVHGLWHTHAPDEKEIEMAKTVMELWGFKPTWFIPPFNEGHYPDEIAGLKVSKLDLRRGERLEDYLHKGTPSCEMLYLHSWRFDNDWYTFKQLDDCLRRLSA